MKKPRVNFCFECGRYLWGSIHQEKVFEGHERVFHKTCWDNIAKGKREFNPESTYDMSNKKTAKGQIDFGLTIDCPHCKQEIDLMDDFSSFYPNEEGEITSLISAYLSNREGADKPNYEVDCPYCEEDFIIEKLEY